jgi:hypothetical protein
MLRVDFTDVRDGGFEPLPEGEYEATVFEVEQKVGQSSGKPYLNWQFKLQDPNYDNRRAFFMTSLSPNALWKLKDTLKALGVDEEDLAGNFELDPQELVGTECTIKIGHEEYNGEVRDRVLDVLPAGSASSGDIDLYR